MAANDGVPEALQVLLSDELLSPSELFKERSRSHKIPVKGQKEFLPDGSDQQRARLQKSLDEHWTLVAEERVERLGNLVSAEWIPKEKLVKLLSPAGKFWQTMGFSDRGKQCLLPEEALYLMECGSVQVFYKDLPLSIQEGYECLLSPETMTLHQYQVFGHLKRLGYVVNRFDPRDMQSKQLKRKRSQSPGSRLCEKQSATTMEQTTVEGECKGEVQIREPDLGHVAPEQGTTQQTSQDKSMECVANSDGASARNWWTDMSGQAQAAAAQAAAPRWDFSCIVFPDLGSHRANSATLAAPDPSLLPGALEVGECKVAHWLRKLNLKKERLSRRDWERQRERDRYKRDINDDREVRRCRNWMEYLDLMEKRRSQQHKERPAHLWEQKVTPLTHPGQCISHRELLEQISIIPSCDLLEGASRLPWSDKWRICFNVYQPDTVAEFKKSHPGKPYTRLCVCSFDGPVPDLCVIKQLSILSGDVPVTFAVVDHGDISFYCFKEFKLPTDIY
ncbi:tRNA-splicing endonuclease subunit Sen54 isoform X2 [Electrophorus electricus]|uniref:tRNA-splicing endonuclease subunit Sen54 isoform X2 n=1 Tax=Electrophorus electricus TaxID=8005 RepID=UPI0015D06899|nr:tRNA-splicing endonuclease subunit Sen54 isoform X2 [Electrophorus electricus]